jgi:hypothetical protein
MFRKFLRFSRNVNWTIATGRILNLILEFLYLRALEKVFSFARPITRFLL